MRTRSLKLLVAGAACLALGTAAAQTAADASAGTTATAAIPAGRIASRFENLAGSPENAASLVTGLRSGSEIALASPDGSTGIAFTPTTRPIRGGNLMINMLGVWAKHQIQTQSGKINEARQHLRDQGKLAYRAPFGYQNIRIGQVAQVVVHTDNVVDIVRHCDLRLEC